MQVFLGVRQGVTYVFRASGHLKIILAKEQLYLPYVEPRVRDRDASLIIYVSFYHNMHPVLSIINLLSRGYNKYFRYCKNTAKRSAVEKSIIIYILRDVFFFYNSRFLFLLIFFNNIKYMCVHELWNIRINLSLSVNVFYRNFIIFLINVKTA